MIIWLASYPRSGNSLFTTVLKKSFSLDSYSCYTEATSEAIGRVSYQESWEEFYRQATCSNETVFVKTHSPPKDEQPFIYIVRDGRLAIQSYNQFHKRFLSDYGTTSLVKLIVGDDAYSDWSTHFYQWNQHHNAKKLLIRYEELVNPTEELLQKIAHFINFRGEIKPFINPFEEHHKYSPDFFREGKTEFQPRPDWTSSINTLFYKVHGNLMKELGYPFNLQQTTEIEDDLLCLVQELRLRQQTLEQQLQPKEELILRLHNAAQELQVQLKQKDELILRLHNANQELHTQLQLQQRLNKANSFCLMQHDNYKFSYNK